MSEFDKWNKYNLGYTGKQAFEAGAQSQQAKIDCLNKNIEVLHVEIERIQKEYQGMFEGVQGRQKTIDELQGRIDEALTYLRHNDFRECKESILFNILKGNKDETGIN